MKACRVPEQKGFLAVPALVLGLMFLFSFALGVNDLLPLMGLVACYVGMAFYLSHTREDK